MNYMDIVKKINHVNIAEMHENEIYIEVKKEAFKEACTILHKDLNSQVLMMFAEDARKESHDFKLYCVFLSAALKKWFLIKTSIPSDIRKFDALSKQIHSASAFEREINESFGLEAEGAVDLRRLNLHDEVWPKGHYPLLKDFQNPSGSTEKSEYLFTKIQGEGIFEIPVGPVHAGIIGPGHFRFSVAGEPIINLEERLGFTHRGIEKLFEGKTVKEALALSECISGETAFAYSLAFCMAIEKIFGILVSSQHKILRAIFLELERMYNHVADIGGIALDVGFSFPANYAAIIKENILSVNNLLTNSRYLKGINKIGGVSKELDDRDKKMLIDFLVSQEKDFYNLKDMLLENASFMDRVETTGILRKKTAKDLGVTGVAARASGLPIDLRNIFSEVYKDINFKVITEQKGDVLARLNVKIGEFMESLNLIRRFIGKVETAGSPSLNPEPKKGVALGFCEAWRGTLIFWIKTDGHGIIERCKIVDPSVHNWEGLTFAVLGNIVPDFPVCNKSFNLSYPGNDL